MIPRGEHSWLTQGHIDMLTVDTPHFVPLEELVETKVVKQTWGARLCSRPWQPWRSYDVVTIPLQTIFACTVEDATVYIGHPEYIKHIKMRRQELME